MRRFILIACAIGVTLGACAASPEHTDPPILSSNTLAIQADSTILWNGRKVDFDTFNRLCEVIARRKPQPEIHVKPDRLARYDAVAKVLANMQRTGATRIGFTGIDTGE